MAVDRRQRCQLVKRHPHERVQAAARATARQCGYSRLMSERQNDAQRDQPPLDHLAEEAIAGRLQELLDEVPELFARYDTVFAVGPASDSPAAEDQLHPLGHLPWTHAGYSWAGAGDHALTYQALRDRGTQPSVGHYSLLRGVLEGSATTRWILEPAESAERIARGVAAERYSYGFFQHDTTESRDTASYGNRPITSSRARSAPVRY